MKRILWLDNDLVFLRPSLYRLRYLGHLVTQAVSVTDAIKEIENNKYDILIIDMMINLSAEEEKIFSPSETNSGHKSGLAFFKHNIKIIQEKSLQTFILTIREDSTIREECLKAGILESNYKTKSEIADLDKLVEWLQPALKD